MTWGPEGLAAWAAGQLGTPSTSPDGRGFAELGAPGQWKRFGNRVAVGVRRLWYFVRAPWFRGCRGFQRCPRRCAVRSSWCAPSAGPLDSSLTGLLSPGLLDFVIRLSAVAGWGPPEGAGLTAPGKRLLSGAVCRERASPAWPSSGDLGLGGSSQGCGQRPWGAAAGGSGGPGKPPGPARVLGGGRGRDSEHPRRLQDGTDTGGIESNALCTLKLGSGWWPAFPERRWAAGGTVWSPRSWPRSSLQSTERPPLATGLEPSECQAAH